MGGGWNCSYFQHIRIVKVGARIPTVILKLNKKSVCSACLWQTSSHILFSLKILVANKTPLFAPFVNWNINIDQYMRLKKQLFKKYGLYGRYIFMNKRPISKKFSLKTGALCWWWRKIVKSFSKLWSAAFD